MRRLIAILLCVTHVTSFAPSPVVSPVARVDITLRGMKDIDPARAKFNEVKKKKNERLKAYKESRAAAAAQRVADAKRKTEREKNREPSVPPKESKGWWPFG